MNKKFGLLYPPYRLCMHNTDYQDELFDEIEEEDIMKKVEEFYHKHGFIGYLDWDNNPKNKFNKLNSDLLISYDQEIMNNYFSEIDRLIIKKE